MRLGVVYTAKGDVRLALPPGRYTVYATRGSEYSLGSRALDLATGGADVALTLAREVDTSGYIACDTHIHTLTFSGHGDSTAEERMVTLAGEGIELPVSTEHNRLVDYRPIAERTGTRRFFTPVTGDEVTTAVGHFNVFPLAAGTPAPEYRGKDRKAILDAIRALPGAPLVIFNHPWDMHSGFRPTDHFHPLSGESLDGAPWEFDGVEVINSGALQSDWMQPYRDWFALLNRGHRMFSSGSSDSHDVDGYIVGQGRTYIASSAKQPDRIETKEACDNLRAGRAVVSLGLFTQAWVDDRFTPADLAVGRGDKTRVRVRVQAPRWITCDRVELWADGEKIATQLFQPALNKPDFTLLLPQGKQDRWLVAIASGPGITAPYWPIHPPYQPMRADWEPRVIGSTNPIPIDGDGDGRYTSPFEYARRAVEQHAVDPPALMRALATYDAATAVQAASLCRAHGIDLRAGAFRQAVEAAAPQVRRGFVAYENVLGTVHD